jgi:glycosyltransferase involved in cell wall biosynthesis
MGSTVRPGATAVVRSTVGRGQPDRVLLVCDWFLKYVGSFSIALRDTGLTVAVLCRDHAAEFGGDRDERQRMVDAMVSAGVEVIELPGRSFSVERGAWRALSRARRFRPDVIHVQSEILDPRFLPAIRGAPVALTVHDPVPHLGTPRKPFRLRALEARWERRADVIIVHSGRLVAGVQAERPMRVVPHGVAPLPGPLRRPETPTILLFGRLLYYKGVRVLLAAMELVWASRPDVKLLIAGEGPEAARIPRDPRVEVLDGYVPEGAVEAVFARASVAVLPYLGGSQSGVGLQAIACGVPLVVTDVGGLPDLVLDSSFVAPPGDPEALADRLLEHVDHGPELRRQVLERARADFSWQVVASRARSVYEEMLASRRDRTVLRPTLSGQLGER